MADIDMPDIPTRDPDERHPIRIAVLAIVLVVALLWIGFQFLQPLLQGLGLFGRGKPGQGPAGFAQLPFQP